MAKNKRIKSPARGNKWILFTSVWMLVSVIAFTMLVLPSITPELAGLAGSINLKVMGLFVPSVLIYCWVTKEKPKIALGWQPLNAKNTLMTILITIAVFPMTFLAMNLLAFVFPWDLLMRISAVREAGFPPLWLNVTPVIIAAVFEELTFRGTFHHEYHGHKLGTSIAKTALITGLFFGLIHTNWHQAIYAMALGILLTYMRYYTRSVIAPILSHLLINVVAAILMPTNLFMDYVDNLWVLAGVSVMMLPLFLFCLKQFKNYYTATQPLHEADSDAASESDELATTKPKVLTWAFWVALGIWVAFILLLS